MKFEELTEKDIKKIITNPFYAIDISEGLTGEHEKMVTEEKWIKANKKLIKEIGVEKWLRGLLDILKGNYT